jgi:serine/threonine protein kinase
LKPANILLDERGHPTIGDLGTGRFCNLRSTMTSGIRTPLYMAPGMYDSADFTGAVDVYSFSLIAYEVLVGKPVFPATTPLPVLIRKVCQGDRPPLPKSMDATIRQIVKQGCSVRPADRRSFEAILEAFRRIRFKMTPAVDTRKVSEFVALVEPSAQLAPAADVAVQRAPKAAAHAQRSSIIPPPPKVTSPPPVKVSHPPAPL